jgi:saccharopine dehydrogenase (NAD+, L-lysine-forming)
MKIGILREGKVPPDKRVPLTPAQCRKLKDENPTLELVVQESPIRAFADDEYRAAGIDIVADVSDCDVIIGVKEVPKDQLIADKMYFYFSHTIKMQPYNRDLLLQMMSLNIRMVDYEAITNEKGSRLIGFGRYAGIVGCYNSFLAYGQKTNSFQLKAANQCADRVEMESELSKVKLPSNFKAVFTGFGRVAHGAAEIVNALGLKQVSVEEYLTQEFDEPVWTQLNASDYNAKDDGQPFDQLAFYGDASGHHSTFMRFAKVSDVYVACHYWESGSPFIFTREDVRSSDWNIKVVGDISCDIDGPVASTIRPSTIAEPMYGYNAITESEDDFAAENTIGVMAVDNLPCELPKDASEDFGNELIKNVIPSLLNNDADGVISRATICANGDLTEEYSYLRDYVNGTVVEG